jgi:acyl-CoA hydrolase
VTELGVARLRGLGEKERATALVAVAHERFREELARSLAR